jgi:alpha-beta hydrolase superfamily lysophospholipase
MNIKSKKTLFIAVSVSACLLLSGCGNIAHKNYAQTFARVEGFSDDQYTSYITWKEMDTIKYSRDEVRFNSRGNMLQGFIYGGANTCGLVVISHGLGGTADSYFPLIMYFVDHGWRVFAFNNTGVGGSEGKDMGGIYQSVIDLDAALDFVEQTSMFAGLPVMLAGHSWGGYAVCAVLNCEHPVNAVVSFAGFNSGSEVFDELGKSSSKFYNFIKPQFRKIEKKRFGDAAKLTAVDGINKAGIPVMIVQSSDDDVISAKTTSIYAHREKITNPHVEIIYRDGEDATGHERVFGSIRRKEYAKSVNASWNEYYEADPENATLLQWAKDNLDKTLANELDADLMERINEFFVKTK